MIVRTKDVSKVLLKMHTHTDLYQLQMFAPGIYIIYYTASVILDGSAGAAQSLLLLFLRTFALLNIPRFASVCALWKFSPIYKAIHFVASACNYTKRRLQIQPSQLPLSGALQSMSATVLFIVYWWMDSRGGSEQKSAQVHSQMSLVY